MAKKVLFVNQEITPYLPESKMSVMGSMMPHKMQDAGYEIRTFMPKWGVINERRGQLHEVIRLSGMNLIIDDTDHPLIIKVASIPQSRIQVYFIDNEDYFQKRNTTVDESGDEYSDNGERAIFFARGVLETVKKLRWTPDVIHCQGWMSAVFPFYAKTAYKDEPQFANAKIVSSFFEDQPKGSLGNNIRNSLVFRDASSEKLEKYDEAFDYLELGKLAIDYSDAIVATGENIDEKLMDYAKSTGKPIMAHPEEEQIQDKYMQLYNSLTE